MTNWFFGTYKYNLKKSGGGPFLIPRKNTPGTEYIPNQPWQTGTTRLESWNHVKNKDFEDHWIDPHLKAAY